MQVATISIVGSDSTNSAQEILSRLLRELGYNVADSDEADGFIFLASLEDSADEEREVAERIWTCGTSRYLLQAEVVAAMAQIPLRELLRAFASSISNTPHALAMTN